MEEYYWLKEWLQTKISLEEHRSHLQPESSRMFTYGKIDGYKDILTQIKKIEEVRNGNV